MKTAIDVMTIIGAISAICGVVTLFLTLRTRFITSATATGVFAAVCVISELIAIALGSQF